MNKALVFGGIGALALLAMSKKADAAASASFNDAIAAMKTRNAKRVGELSSSKTFDSGTQSALRDQAERMNARLLNRAVPPAPPLVPLTSIDVDNNEFAAKVFFLEGDVNRLKQWEAAYRPVYPPIAEALRGKLSAIEQLKQPPPPLPTNPATPPVPVVVPTPSGPVTIPVPPTISNPAPVVVPVPPLPVTPAPSPNIIQLPSVTATPTVAEDPLKKRTRDFIAHLNSRPRPTEDQDQVRFWQQSVGQKPDGLYGTGDALIIAERFDLIPPLPRRFPKDVKKMLASKAEYKRRILAIAANEPDPARQKLWIAASKVDNQ